MSNGFYLLFTTPLASVANFLDAKNTKVQLKEISKKRHVELHFEFVSMKPTDKSFKDLKLNLFINT